jgi:hypothetical protein
MPKRSNSPRKKTTRASSTGRRASGATLGEQRSSNVVRTALIQGQTFGIKAVQYSVVDGLAMFEGDIILGTDAQVQARTQQLRAQMTGAPVAYGVAITGAQYRWPNCTIPYTIDSTLTSQSRVTDAIAHWQAHTSFRFVVRSSEADYVTFRPSTGCSSSVGRQGGQQFVNLGSGCTTGNCIHEIGHVTGLWHEQSREDRDSFVTITWTKIQPGFSHNFDQHISDGDDIGAYDYGSIMHYPRDAFSIDGTDTITPVTAGVTIGQRTALSAGDIAAANSLCPTILTTIKETRKDVAKDAVFDTGRETIKEPPKDFKEPPKDFKEPPKDLKEPPKDFKEPPRDTGIETVKEPIKDRKEPVKDIKELPRDTIKERIKEPIKDTKESLRDTIKEQFKDPFKDRKEPTFDPVGPGPFIPQPGPLLPQPGLRPALPFAVSAPHQAPAALGSGLPESAAETLDAHVQGLGEQLAQLEQLRAELEAQYEEAVALLQQALGEGGGQGT